MMPRMDGWALVRGLRSLPELQQVPVIFLTALGGDDDRIQGFRLGADDYLPKPFRFEELDLRVGNALRKREEILRAAQPKPPPIPQRARTATPGAVPAVASGIHGSLAQLGLPSLLTMMEMEQKSGILVLSHEQQAARLFVRKGRILAARIDGDESRGAEAVYKLMAWATGQFDFNAMEVDMEDEINATTMHLIMEGARRMDEGI
jgi:CheY-like chemotaxis protein